MKVNLAHALHSMSRSVIYSSRLGNGIAVPFHARMRISVIALLAISACGRQVLARETSRYAPQGHPADRINQLQTLSQASLVLSAFRRYAGNSIRMGPATSPTRSD